MPFWNSNSTLIFFHMLPLSIICTRSPWKMVLSIVLSQGRQQKTLVTNMLLVTLQASLWPFSMSMAPGCEYHWPGSLCLRGGLGWGYSFCFQPFCWNMPTSVLLLLSFVWEENPGFGLFSTQDQTIRKRAGPQVNFKQTEQRLTAASALHLKTVWRERLIIEKAYFLTVNARQIFCSY